VFAGLVDLAGGVTSETDIDSKGSVATEGRGSGSGGVTTLVCSSDTRPLLWIRLAVAR